MKKFIFKGLVCVSVLLPALCQSAFAATGSESIDGIDYGTDNFSYNYQVSSGLDYDDVFGQPTETDVIPRNTETENVRRNKDTAFTPPMYGTFSGAFDTERSNPYIAPDKIQYANIGAAIESIPQSNTLGNGIEDGSGMLPSTSLMYENNDSATSANVVTTQAKQYSDGSIGTLEIPKLNVKAKVWEGETLDNLKIGVGHFTFTSTWDGNVGLCGHNSGSSGYFEDIHKLIPGDKIIYTTKYGTRTYRVSTLTTISVTDFSTLGYTDDNRLTLITCVQGIPDQRLSLVAMEIKE